MSPDFDDIYHEVINHMKSSGDYDFIRVSLKDPIERGKDYQSIVEKFRDECERFCETVDLKQNRQILRSKLGTRFESYSRSRSELINLIRRSLEDKNEELKANFYEKARTFLRRFLEPNQEIEANIDMDIDMDIDSSLEDHDDMQEREARVESEERLEREDQEMYIKNAAHKNIKEDQDEMFKDDKSSGAIKAEEAPSTCNDAKIADDANIVDDSRIKVENLDDIVMPEPIESTEEPTDLKLDKEAREITEEDDPEDPPRPPFSPIGDDLEQLTFSSVSSIKTSDLSDFEDSIDLSEDEANIIGKPLNSKIGMNEINHTLNRKLIDLHANINETDGSSTTGRAARTRKSNPKYNNDLYKL